MSISAKEKKGFGHARLLGSLVNDSLSNQSRIATLREEGRRLGVMHGLRSEPVKAKAAEIDRVFEREARVGVLVQRLQERIGKAG